ncbi:MAG: Clostripain family [Actinomycetota bacterium]|nr:Clostripain family [Actinomycetota bacterium]
MPSWSVIVWAVVTPDLEDAIRADLAEAGMALGQPPAGCDIHLHVNIVRAFDGATTIWPQIDDASFNDLWPRGPDHPHDVLTNTDLDGLLSDAGCWQEADHRFLVLWGHGERAVPTKTTGRDGAVPAVRKVIDAIAGRASPDIIGYDACWMATVHTVIALAKGLTTTEGVTTGVFIGSMVPEPVSGWPYAELIQILCRPGDPKAVAAAVVQAYDASLSAPDRSMVALDLAEVAAEEDGPTKPAGLIRALETLMSVDPPDRVVFFTAADGADILEDTNLADLGALMRGLQVGRVDGNAAAVGRALLKATVSKRTAGGLNGRDGVAVLLGVPGDSPPEPAWPAQPSWQHYFPDIAPLE